MKVDPNELRQRFLDFFDARMKEHAGGKVKGSLKLPSSSLQPPDASTLFTSAGMHQFKDDFTGNLVHGTRAATTVQKCMRTPDLENVGKTARHHTFFEMLGYFSFGDGLDGPNGSKGFFKKEAIRWIWDFYTLPWDKGGCGLDTSKLYVSVYGGDEKGEGRDDEAAELWRRILGKLWDKAELEKRIFFLGEHDNFWPAGAPSQGPNGVCGPCSEIFYDLGEEYGQGNVETNGDRFMEIGNIVFTQYERSGPAPGKGTLTPLPSKNIDFGGGFERLVMVLDGAKTTLDCALFSPVRKKLRELGGLSEPEYGSEEAVREKRIADHVRAVAFSMSDGILPSNEGAGYVIRRIIRRAFRDGSALGFDGPFLYKLVPVIVEHYGDAYPELKRNTNAVINTIQQEEQQFSTTLERGLQLLAGLIRDVKTKGESVLPGKPAFDLYQSQGLPREVVQDELAAEGLKLDQLGYQQAEDAHRTASKGTKQASVFEKGWFQELKKLAKGQSGEPSQKKLESAIADCTAIIEDPVTPEAERAMHWLARASLLLVQQDWEAALRDLDAVESSKLVKQIGISRVPLIRAYPLKKLGRLDDAIRELSRGIDDHSIPSTERADALLDRGKLRETQGAKEQAAQDYALALELPGVSHQMAAELRSRRGVLLGELGRPEEAINEFTKVVEDSKTTREDRSLARFNRAVTNARRDRIDDAVYDLRRVLESPGASESTRAESRLALAQVLAMKGETTAALEILSEARESKDASVEVRDRAVIARVMTLSMAGEVAKAQEAFRSPEAQSVADSKLRGLAHLTIVHALIGKKRFDDALNLLNEAGSDTTDDEDIRSRARLLRIELFKLTGRHKHAVEEYEELLLDPKTLQVAQQSAKRHDRLPYAQLAGPSVASSTSNRASPLADLANSLADSVGSDGTKFVGYEVLTVRAKILGIVRDGKLCPMIEKDDSAIIVLDRTPFYGESGGQLGDRGSLQHGGATFEVADTQKRDDYHLHEGKLLHGKLRVGDAVVARVDVGRRERVKSNHSATHLLHAALRTVLGDHVVQRGSEVGPDRLRFDFSHPKALTFEERQKIEKLVNEQVQANTDVGTAVMSPEDAQKAGAMALFGEKYGDKVRVLTMGREGFSKELCGGTHVARTGDIGYFRIINEGSSSAGVRRIEAVTGQDAYDLAAEEARQLAELHALTKAQPGQVVQKVQSLVKEVKDLKGKSKKGGGVDANALKTIRDKAETVGDVTVYVAEVPGAEAPDLLTIKDALGQDSAPSAIVLGSRGEGKALLVVAFSKDLVGRGLHAGKIVGEMARLVGGGGGGKPEVAQAGGKNPEGLEKALDTGRERVKQALQK